MSLEMPTMKPKAKKTEPSPEEKKMQEKNVARLKELVKENDATYSEWAKRPDRWAEGKGTYGPDDFSEKTYGQWKDFNKKKLEILSSAYDDRPDMQKAVLRENTDASSDPLEQQKKNKDTYGPLGDEMIFATHKQHEIERIQNEMAQAERWVEGN